MNILLHGGDKSTQANDIALAKQFWNDLQSTKEAKHMTDYNATDYKDDLLADLADPEYAAQYVTAAYRESCGAFLIALKDVADARFGMTKLANNVKANRVSLYRSLSEGGNPTLNTFNSILEALNLDVSFSPRAAVASNSRPIKSKRILRGSKGNGRAAVRTDNRSRNKSLA